MARDSFEVYYYQNGRWQLHASFESGEREVAVEEASMVASKEGFPTRVVRETFYADKNTTEDVVAWQSAKAKQIDDADDMFGNKAAEKGRKKKPTKRKSGNSDSSQRQAPPRGGPPPSAEPASAPNKAGPAAKKKKKAVKKGAPKGKIKRKRKKKKASGVARAIMTLAVSMGIAAIGAAAVAVVVAQLVAMEILPPANRLPLINGTFISLFFLSAIVNLQKNFNLLGMLRGGSPRQAKSSGPDQMLGAMKVAAQPAPAQDVDFDQVEVEHAIESSGLEDTPEEEMPAELDADMDAEVDSEPEPEPEKAEEEPAAVATEEKEEKKAEESKQESEQKKPEEKKPEQKPHAEAEVQAGIGQFIKDGLNSIRAIELNTFTRFGLNLYVAGAASVIGQSKRLGRDEQLAILKDSLVSAGTNPASATSFCVELPAHGKNPRYAGMIQSGSKAMTQYLGGARNVGTGLKDLLAEWNLPDKRPPVPSVITFVFTDIVGSTAMTQKLGNAGAQKAVRAHNDAVRNAIKGQKGREVKHTGDGIMATFPSPAAAVAGSISMQRAVHAHNAKNLNMQVHVRIGINAGEAVEEENDFFGAAVQMTARICDKASTGNIWVSQGIVEACKGQKFGFIPRGGFDMKGIQGRKPLYEVGWSDVHKNELADL
jgi:adenylate cyclase